MTKQQVFGNLYEKKITSVIRGVVSVILSVLMALRHVSAQITASLPREYDSQTASCLLMAIM